jgi:hypothetical protein
MTRVFECTQCFSTRTVAVLYAFSAVAIMLVVRLMGHFTLADNCARMKASGSSVTTSATQAAAVAASNTASTPAAVSSSGYPVGLRKSSVLQQHTSDSNSGVPRHAELAAGGSAIEKNRGLLQHLLVSARTSELSPSDVCKSFVLYLQYLLLVAALQIDWPDTISYPYTALSWLWATSSSEVLSLECLIKATSSSAGTWVPVPIQRVLIYVFAPAVMLVVMLLLECLVTFAVRAVRRHRRQRQSPPQVLPRSHPISNRGGHGGGVVPLGPGVSSSLGLRCLVLSMVTLYISMPTMLRALLSMFMCLGIDDPNYIPYGCATAAVSGRYWAYDLNQACWQGYHRSWALGFGLPLVLLLCILLPLGLAVFMLCNRAKLGDPSFQARFGFLYRDYMPRYCAWEAVMLMQTIVLVCVAVFGYVMVSYHQALVMNAALALIMLLQAIFKPYHSRPLHALRLISCCCLLFTSYGAMSFIPSYEGVTVSESYKLAMGAIITVVNSLFAVFAFVLLARAVNWEALKVLIRRLSRALGRACNRISIIGGGSN